MARNSTSIKIEGGLLPGDFLRQIGKGEEGSIPGLTSGSYHLDGGRLHDAISASWNAVRGRWVTFNAALKSLPESDPATSVTRERFLLPLFAELQYGRLIPEKARVIDGVEYPISHYWGHSPIHLLGANVPLDRRSAGVAGASRTSPHGLIQDYLNRTPDALWGFLSNGRTLRVLRDAKTISRPSYIEFDLTSMFEADAYSDFVILWLLCHQSRVEAEDSHKCFLEQWVSLAQDQGTRALEKLRFGVAKALIDLGQGFLEEPGNSRLRQLLGSEKLLKIEYYKQVIRIVYRIMFLFAGEDRDILFPEKGDQKAKQAYLDFYSASRLRDLAIRTFGTRHTDLWEGLKFVFSTLSVDGCQALALPALNSFLWEPKSTAALNDATLSNARLLSVIRNLAFITEDHARQRVDYRNIGAEEIGGIYENIIALSPLLDVQSFTFTLGEGAFSEQDETASHYTPTCLVDELLNSALDPVLDRACKEKDPAAAILALKVCDRACGSGHFLVAAAKRMAKRLAGVRTGEVEPSPEHIQKALRDVIAHCIYGVDLNPTAVELCKFSLWLESMDHGRPLSFLENRIKYGNALLGATPAAIEKGIPDEAFAVLEGDDKAVVAGQKKQNKRERSEAESGGQEMLFAGEVLWVGWVEVRKGAERIIAIDDQEITHIHEKQKEYDRLLVSDCYLNQKLIADAWCAAFVLPRLKGTPAITFGTFEGIKNNPATCPTELREMIGQISEKYHFFHWHIEFPEVYGLPDRSAKPENELCGWNGGFDANLGNPPWDRVKIQEKEWFAERVPEIAAAENAARRKTLIDALRRDDPGMFERFTGTLRRADGESHLLRDSGMYPLCGRGDVNLYSVFAEAMRQHISASGRVGAVLPSGIATDDTTKDFFRNLMTTRTLLSLFDFQSGPGLFAEIGHARFKFCLFTLIGEKVAKPAAPIFAFYLRDARHINDPHKRFTLTADDLALTNPNSGTCPIFRSPRDAELTLAIYRRVPVILQENSPFGNPWEIRLSRMFDMSNDSSLFRTREQLRQDGWKLDGNVFRRDDVVYRPLYEAKMMHQFEHRFGDYSAKPDDSESTALPDVAERDLANADFMVMPQYWLPEEEILDTTAGRFGRRWFPCYRRIARAGDFRTMISTILPFAGIADKAPVILSNEPAARLACCIANLNSFACDFAVRQKVGGTQLDYHHVFQFPVLPPKAYEELFSWIGGVSFCEWLLPRILELIYTARDLEDFAHDCGLSGPPFRWDKARRFLIRCELDAAFFHLYLPMDDDGNWKQARIVDGAVRDETDTEFDRLKDQFPTPRDAIIYILGTFPIVQRKDEKAYGCYRTKDTVLGIYDDMARAMASGKAYLTRLNPPPADPACCHPPTAPSEMSNH